MMVVALVMVAMVVARRRENELDTDGNPVTGPNLAMQWFSADPGRSVITGSPNDFEAFDVPTLRGIAKTAPYFHNNIAETLERVVDLYSDHFLARSHRSPYLARKSRTLMVMQARPKH
jgi:cytochrome c peroxidase